MDCYIGRTHGQFFFDALMAQIISLTNVQIGPPDIRSADRSFTQVVEVYDGV